MKRGFTLIEIIIVLSIIAVILGSAVANVAVGMKSARLRDAARTVQLYTRHAKAVALLKGRPVVLQFEEVMENGEFSKSRVSLSFSGDASSGSNEIGVGHGGSGSSDGLTRTLSGQLVGVQNTADGSVMTSDGVLESGGVSVEDASPDAGEVQDPLMAQPREFEGVRIHAALRDEKMERPRISVFSTADFLLKKKAEETARKTRAAEKKAEESGVWKDDKNANGELPEEEEKESSFSVVYEANGRCEPFTVTVYKDGTDERDGLTVNIGRFGRTVTGD